MRCFAAAIVAACVLVPQNSFAAVDCPGNPKALGTSRVITIDPADHTRIGSMQYSESLPLADKEVVITFDDGPLPRYTNRILETLAAECVKATFFLVGNMARAYPEWVRRVYNEGHTLGTHSFSHPRYFRRLSYNTGVAEIENGVAAVETALGDKRALAPFFRFPGLGSSAEMEGYLAKRGLMTWSADFPADDWKHISAAKVKERALSRLEHKGRGVLLLHDIQPATALALPEILRELKARGYRIVHVVAAGADRPKTVTEPQAWVFNRPRVPTWPVVLPPDVSEPPAISAPSALSFGFPYPMAEKIAVGSFDGERPAMELPQSTLASRPGSRMRTVWPRVSEAGTVAATSEGSLSAPGLGEMNEPSMFGGKRFTPQAPAAPGQAALEQKPAKLASAPRRTPRAPQARPQPPQARPPLALVRQLPAEIRTASAQEPVAAQQRGAGEAQPPAWARMLNWIYNQP
jgi:peptidoglycan/xylan/chitin deacetylase (PgdA/CDA1 family)